MLNIKKYEIKAKYLPTNRQRKVTIEARSEDDAISKLGSDYTDVVSIVPIVYPPSERQISYAQSLGIIITDDMCAEDVSCLISSQTSDTQPPKQGLIDFADARKIVFSNYIGKKRLYNYVFSGLPEIDRVAFFIFSIYRHLSDDRESNLDKSYYRKYFYEFAYTYVNEDKFRKSLFENYSGEDLRFFGTLTVRDAEYEHSYYGGSTQTYAFKCAKQYLIENGLVPADVKNSKVLRTSRPVASASPEIPTTPDYQVTVPLTNPAMEEDPTISAQIPAEMTEPIEEPKEQKGCLFYLGVLFVLYLISRLL